MKKSRTIFPFDGIKFRYCENATKFGEIFQLFLKLLSNLQNGVRYFFQILWPSQKVWTFTAKRSWEMFCGLIKKHLALFYTLKLLSFSFFQQHKRKLADVSKKLEVLYDKLREDSVSISISILFTIHFFTKRTIFISYFSYFKVKF